MKRHVSMLARLTILSRAWRVPTAAPADKLLLLALAYRADANGHARLPLETIAGEIGVTLGGVQASLAALMKAGYVTVIGASGAATVAQVHPRQREAVLIEQSR